MEMLSYVRFREPCQTIVEAAQWWPGTSHPGVIECHRPVWDKAGRLPLCYAVVTRRGIDSFACPGDWIVNEGHYGMFVLKNADFRATYRPVPQVDGGTTFGQEYPLPAATDDVQALKEVLAFYADPMMYLPTAVRGALGNQAVLPIMGDRGQIARAALGIPED